MESGVKQSTELDVNPYEEGWNIHSEVALDSNEHYLETISNSDNSVFDLGPTNTSLSLKRWWWNGNRK